MLLALVTGLRLELATVAPAMTCAQATDVITRALAALTQHAEGCRDLSAAS